MKRLLLPVLCLFITTMPAQLMLKIHQDSVSAFTYSGGDEFNTQQLDASVWNNGLGWTRVLMSQDLAFSTEDVKLGNGMLRLIAEKKDSLYTLSQNEIDSAYLKKEKLVLDQNHFLTKYSVGCIISKQKMHYGLYELRFKVEEGRGVWPAFWFYGGNKNEEIDAFELKGEKNDQIHVDTHCPEGCDRGYTDKFSFSKNWGAWLPVSDYLHNGFNLMFLEWTPDHLNWYINGYLLAYFKGKFPNPMHLYINTSVAKDGGAFKPGPDAGTKWPNHYDVDYIRVWKALDANQDLSLTASEDLSNANLYEGTYQIKPKKKKGLTYKKKEFETLNGIIYLSLNKNNKLKIRVNGKITERKTLISLEGKLTKATLLDYTKESVFDIPPSETELTLSIQNKDGRFQKRILLIR